jgi:glycosyltransferase involved in cell wall biosynthesis
VLCLGITPEDHEWLQGHSANLEECAEYLHGNSITCALAHPFYAVAAPLEQRHRRRLAELFGVWEVRNGSRAHELNMPAAIYVDTRGGTGVGGSDDHAGVDIGRTWTSTPRAQSTEEFLDLIRAGEAAPGGEQGSAAKWAHAAIAIATRSLLAEPPADAPAPDVILRLIQRVVGEGGEREGGDSTDFTSTDAAALLNAWLTSVELPAGRKLIELMQADDFSHRDLFRLARSTHDARLREATILVNSELASSDPSSAVLPQLFDACMPVVPYLPAATFLANERRRLSAREGEPRRVALVVDGVDAPHGVSHTIERIRELGVPGFEVEVVGTDRGVDRRLPAAAELEVPFEDGLRLGVPSLPGLLETLAEGRFDLIHVATPGPAGVAAALSSRLTGIPLLASHHTEFVAYARERSGSDSLAAVAGMALALFYRECGIVLSPSTSADRSLADLGVPAAGVARWVRGVDTSRFSPDRRRRDPADGRISVLYSGRQTREKGMDLLADAFLLARSREPRLRLVLAGTGPEETRLRERLGDAAEFRGWLRGDDLARAYADADAFLFPSSTDTYGQVVVEAQASGVPVVAVRSGGPADLIEDWRSGVLCEPSPEEIAAKLLRIVDNPPIRERLVRGGMASAAERTWARALEQLAEGYRIALGEGAVPADRSPLAPVSGPRVTSVA